MFQKSLPIFSDMWIFTNGLVDKLEGKKNIVLAFIIGLLFILSYRFSQRKHPKSNWFIIASVISLGLSSFLFKDKTLGFWVLSSGVFITYLTTEILVGKSAVYSKKHLWFLLIIGIVPTAFLIFNAVRSGHTYGLTQRYSGFSFPYVIILASIALGRLREAKNSLKLGIMILLGIQLFFVIQTLQIIYADRSPKYNYRTEPRQPNPHYAAAQKAQKL